MTNSLSALRRREHLKGNTERTIRIVVLAFTAFLFLCGVVAAQNDKVEGLISGRNGDTMTVETQDSEKVVVALTDFTQVLELVGAFRKKRLAVTALVPGLPVEVQGSFNDKYQMVAEKVTFRGSDLKTAQDIQTGIAPTEQQVQQSQQQLQAQQHLPQQEVSPDTSAGGRPRTAASSVFCKTRVPLGANRRNLEGEGSG